MTKAIPVDVKASVAWQKANGRFVPAEKQEVASAKLKTFVCQECGKEIKKEQGAFGETEVCACGGVMIEKTLF